MIILSVGEDNRGTGQREFVSGHLLDSGRSPDNEKGTQHYGAWKHPTSRLQKQPARFLQDSGCLLGVALQPKLRKQWRGVHTGTRGAGRSTATSLA